MPNQAYNVDAIREKFPSLHQQVEGVTPIYLDNPGGTQVSQAVIDAMVHYLKHYNSNKGGAFYTSRMTDMTSKKAHESIAAMLNAPAYEQIIYGPNMTTLTFHISRSIGLTLSEGDEIMVTRMDHDANIAPWLHLADNHDLTIRWVDFDTETGRLNYDQMADLANDKTKVIACSYASNALGTINDIPRVVEIAQSVGAMTYIDAVQAAPHIPIDVQALDVDFLACSAYKFFGPHMGMVYGKREHLERLPAYQVRPAPQDLPYVWETGTGQFEAMAGTTAAVNYLAWIGQTFNAPGEKDQTKIIHAGMQAIADYEQRISEQLIDGLQAINGVTVHGITEELADRVPTIIFTVDGHDPHAIQEQLGDGQIYLWSGNYYAQAVMESFGVEGMVRVGAAHYNTQDEIDTFLERLEGISTQG